MRLLDVDTLKLHEFMGYHIPKYQYAILSHTWAEGEVSLQELEAGSGPSKQGYEKIVLTCEQAKRHGYRWAWVDTCCIDKTSSAELSEAINSMYQWYKESAVCYAYLTDVDNSFPYASPSKEGGYEPLVSRWFTRAWTLQELIAPSNIIFYGPGWVKIGELSEERIQDSLLQITRIPKSVISSQKSSLSHYSVTQKMSWAADRSSTRTEDIAYSLLGLFDINMPLLYGEGPKAFVRLQEEILKETDDHSLLCWTVPRFSPRVGTLEGVFAKSPDDFTESGNVVGNLYDAGSPSVMTNRGLQIHVHLRKLEYGIHSHLYFGNPATASYHAGLNAGYYENDKCVAQMSIVLIRTPPVAPRSSRLTNKYARLTMPTLERRSLGWFDSDEAMDQIYMNKTLLSWEQDRFGFGGVHLQNIPIAETLAPFSTSKRDICAPDIIDESSFQIENVRYSILSMERGNTYQTIKSLPWAMTWSQVYGCVKFDVELPQLPEFPYFVVFVAKHSYSTRTYFISLVWNGEYFHFSVRPAETQSNAFFRSLLDPSDPSTQQGNCWDMYGEIAMASMVIHGENPSKLDFILEREDPDNDEGEVAGNRLHFLIRAEIDKERNNMQVRRRGPS
ncbi:HET-domain-containing protein [Daldinia caldariorum]|uniref:HET-domain-containing protein n=1 Tax=Daldinia caldariorum TaxID=326644 RepID=UPI002008567A|nr:HET-domain-containing protein [Daldinia caldariorum]KAI1472485.1 HET-domain-containing protein [Daldinia caldariorum]